MFKRTPKPEALESTDDLIRRSNAGDHEAFRLLIEKYQRLVAMIVFRIVRQHEDGLDICQDVFLKVFEHLSEFRAQSEFSTWIGRIARNTALSHLKKKRMPSFSEISPSAEIFEAVSHPEPSPEQSYQADARQTRLEQEVAALPEQDRTMLALFHQQGMDYEAIGRTLDIPVSSVKSHLFRARKKLRESLAKDATRQEAS